MTKRSSHRTVQFPLRLYVVILLAALLAPNPASAVITFTQLDDDVFVISHRIKGLGNRGKAMRLVYTKSASLCVAAGYTHFKVLDQESDTGQQYQAANASIRAQFYLGDGEGRVECKRNSEAGYIEEAEKRLRKKRYKPPAIEPTADEVASDSNQSKCTVEQITTMVKAGLSEEQIKAACESS